MDARVVLILWWWDCKPDGTVGLKITYFYICLTIFKWFIIFKLECLSAYVSLVIRNCDDGLCGMWIVIIWFWYSGCMIDMLGCARKHVVVPKPIENWFTSGALGEGGSYVPYSHLRLLWAGRFIVGVHTCWTTSGQIRRVGLRARRSVELDHERVGLWKHDNS